MGGPTRSFNSSQHSSPGHRSTQATPPRQGLVKGTESAQCLRERLQTQIDNKKEEENPPLSFSKTHAHMNTRASTHRDKPDKAIQIKKID